MTNLEQQLTVLMKLCAAETQEDRAALRRKLRQMLRQMPLDKQDPEQIIRQILLDLGAPDHLMGHEYVVYAVQLMVEDGMYIHNISFGLYPQVAAKFDTTASRVERAMRNLIDVTWSRGDWEVLHSYFGNTIHEDRGKPTNSEFLTRMTNVVRQRMRGVS